MDHMVGKGICEVSDLYKGQSFMSYEIFKNQFNLTDKGDFWTYLQLRSSVGSVGAEERGERGERDSRMFELSSYSTLCLKVLQENVNYSN